MATCATPGCKHKVLKNGHCNTCRKRKWRKAHPLEYLYISWRDNAKRRGKDFTVTFDEFKEFCKETKYDELRGRTSLSLSIDRVRNYEGYHKDNIRAITIHDNSSKGDSLEYTVDTEFKMEIEPCPF
jgi:hypothetical protein